MGGPRRARLPNTLREPRDDLLERRTSTRPAWARRASSSSGCSSAHVSSCGDEHGPTAEGQDRLAVGAERVAHHHERRRVDAVTVEDPLVGRDVLLGDDLDGIDQVAEARARHLGLLVEQIALGDEQHREPERRAAVTASRAPGRSSTGWASSSLPASSSAWMSAMSSRSPARSIAVSISDSVKALAP